MRHVKLRTGKELDVEALIDLMEAVYHDIRRRLGRIDHEESDTTMKKTKSGSKEGKGGDSPSQ